MNSWKPEGNGRVLFTADLHFGHEDVIRSNERPFSDVEEMDEALVSNWNGVVEDDDDVHLVGDFAYRVQDYRLRQLFDRLKGRKHLTVGNHDGKATLRLPWASPPAERRHVILGNVDMILDHYPGKAWLRSGRGCLQLYGHSHGRTPGTRQSLDVGVDCWDFRPVDLPAIQARLATLPPLHGAIADEETVNIEETMLHP